MVSRDNHDNSFADCADNDDSDYWDTKTNSEFQELLSVLFRLYFFIHEFWFHIKVVNMMVKVIRVIINQYDGQSDMSDHRTLQRVIKMMIKVRKWWSKWYVWSRDHSTSDQDDDQSDEYDGQSDQYDSQSDMFDQRTVQRGGTTASDLWGAWRCAIKIIIFIVFIIMISIVITTSTKTVC